MKQIIKAETQAPYQTTKKQKLTLHQNNKQAEPKKPIRATKTQQKHSAERGTI